MNYKKILKWSLIFCGSIFVFKAGTSWNNEKNSLNGEVIKISSSEMEYPVNTMTLQETSRLVLAEAELVSQGGGIQFECAAALSAMEYTHSNISGYTTAIVSKLDEYDNFVGDVAEKAQYFSYGFCRAKALVMKQILNNLEIECREVSFWQMGGEERSHACLEVKWNDEWHFFDPTYGIYFGADVDHILSWEEIRKLPKDKAYGLLVKSDSSLANSIVEFEGGEYDYIVNARDVGTDGNSVIHIKVGITPSLISIPAWIGIGINSNEELCEVKYVLENLSDYQEIEIVCEKNSSDSIIVLNGNGKGVEMSLDINNSVSIDLGNFDFPDLLEIEMLDKSRQNQIFISSIKFTGVNKRQIIKRK